MSRVFWLLALWSVSGALAGCQPRQESRLGNGSTVGSVVATADVESTVPADSGAEEAADVEATAASPAASTEITSLPPLPARRDPDALQRVTFTDLEINMKEDMVFDPSLLTERVKQLDGRRVRIRGFMYPAIFQQTGIDKFPLVMNLECKFGPGGQADHVIIVELVGGVTTSFTVRPISIEGRLTVQPWNGPDGNTWSLYHLEGEKVE